MKTLIIIFLVYMAIAVCLFFWLMRDVEDSKESAILFIMSEFWPFTLLLYLCVWIDGRKDKEN